MVIINGNGISSFTLPFIFKEGDKKLAFENMIQKHGIESRPLISGNLVRQPFLKKYYNKSQFKNSDFIHNNAFYIGNNQFVNEERIDYLEKLMNKFFD
tara:strand:- start:177 stop:470 length:294 start_codon:yes stop_codon:yes gene_type:complete